MQVATRDSTGLSWRSSPEAAQLGFGSFGFIVVLLYLRDVQEWYSSTRASSLVLRFIGFS